MEKVNISRVIAGGFLAGLVIITVEYLLHHLLLAEEWTKLMEAHNIPPIGGAGTAWIVVILFVLGIAVVWLYTAIQPRFGDDTRSAIIAGLTAWFFTYGISLGSGAVVLPANLVLITLAGGLIELPLASLAGAWLYRRGPGTSV